MVAPTHFQSAIVLGAGVMGSGIAQWLAQNGVKVEIVDTSLPLANEAHKRILLDWSKLESKGKFSSEQVRQFQDNIVALETSQMSHNADLLIEAIVENESIKKQVLKELDQKLRPHCVLATNTSSLSVQAISSELSAERQKRFLGLHFFNPATIMKLVEIIPTVETSMDLIADVEKWLRGLGKVTALCQDSPGFIVNRLARNFYGEAMRINGPTLNEDKMRQIDTIMKEVGGFKMGPFELMDMIGHDVNYQVSQSVWQAFHQEPRFQPYRLQASLVQSGHLGRKSKKGFFRYD
jgi:3-hydroxybutyryl-CoA dehydrogenase